MAIVPDKVVRTSRRTVSVSVDNLGRVIVRAPLRYANEKIAQFLAEKESWILKHKQRIMGAGIRLPSETLNGYSLLLLGEAHTVELIDGGRIRLDGERKRIYLPRENAEEKLRRWLKENPDAAAGLIK